MTNFEMNGHEHDAHGRSNPTYLFLVLEQISGHLQLDQLP